MLPPWTKHRSRQSRNDYRNKSVRDHGRGDPQVCRHSARSRYRPRHRWSDPDGGRRNRVVRGSVVVLGRPRISGPGMATVTPSSFRELSRHGSSWLQASWEGGGPALRSSARFSWPVRGQGAAARGRRCDSDRPSQPSPVCAAALSDGVAQVAIQSGRHAAEAIIRRQRSGHSAITTEARWRLSRACRRSRASGVSACRALGVAAMAGRPSVRAHWLQEPRRRTVALDHCVAEPRAPATRHYCSAGVRPPGF